MISFYLFNFYLNFLKWRAVLKISLKISEIPKFSFCSYCWLQEESGRTEVFPRTVLEWEPSSDSWRQVAEIRGRSHHEALAVPDSFLPACTS